MEIKALSKENTLELAVKITPKAGRNEIIGWENNELKIRIAALPEKGNANQELIKFLSKTLGLAKSQIELISGDKSRHKRLLIKGLLIFPEWIRNCNIE